MQCWKTSNTCDILYIQVSDGSWGLISWAIWSPLIWFSLCLQKYFVSQLPVANNNPEQAPGSLSAICHCCGGVTGGDKEKVAHGKYLPSAWKLHQSCSDGSNWKYSHGAVNCYSERLIYSFTHHLVNWFYWDKRQSSVESNTGKGKQSWGIHEGYHCGLLLSMKSGF